MLTTKSISHEEFLRRKRNKKLRRFSIFIFFLALIIGLASYVSHRQEIRISKIELNGGILVTQSDIESKALTHLYGSYFWLFPKGNAFWYPKTELAQYLKETFRRIDTINIHRKGFQTLVIDIKERKPFALWCDNISVTEPDSETCFFMDQNSTIFAKAPNFSGDAYFKYFGILATSTDESPIGKEYIASTTEFEDISNFVLKTKNLELRPQYMLAKDNDEFSLIIGGGGQIYFDIKEPMSTASQNLDALLRTPAFQNIKGDLPVEYIDLRYGNKLFYKLK